MFLSRPDIEKLGAMHAVSPSVLSLYLAVPADPAELPSLPGRAGELVTAAERGARARVAEEDRSAVRQKLAGCGRDWLGRTVAVFACADIGLLQALPLPCALPERAVLGIRPHVRPLLLALQRCPAYRVAVVGETNARLYLVAQAEIEPLVAPPEWILRHGERHPLVIGGHEDGIRRLLASVPPSSSEFFAGSFTADPDTLTVTQARDLAEPYIAQWTQRRARSLADEILAMPHGGLAAVGLQACLAAVNCSAVDTLIVPDGGLVPGYECGRCGALGTDADSCPDWGTAPLHVPDVIEEMVTRTLEDGGQVCVLTDVPAEIVARLYFPLAR